MDALFIHHRITASPSTPVQAKCYLAGGGCCLESRTWRSRGSGRSSCSESEPASRRKNKVRSSQASRHKVKSQCYDWRPLRNRGCSFTLYHTGKIRGMELKTKSKDLFVPQCGELLQSMRKNRRGGSIWAKKNRALGGFTEPAEGATQLRTRKFGGKRDHGGERDKDAHLCDTCGRSERGESQRDTDERSRQSGPLASDTTQ